MFRGCLERGIHRGISEESHSSVLMASLTVWIKGIRLYRSSRKGSMLHKTKESEHPPEANVFAEARGKRVCRECAVLLPAFFMCYGFLRSKHLF